jgi:hypothetical protein
MSKVTRRNPGVFHEIARQAEFGMAKALTAVAKMAQVEVEAQMPRRFDRPSPFTQRGIGIRAARKGALKAAVFVRPIQARYLRVEEEGGTRRPARRALVIPINARKNQYGNLPARALLRLKARPDVYVGTLSFKSGEEIGGVWQRGKGAPKLLIRFVGEAEYKPRFGFRQTVVTVVRAHLRDEAVKEINAAIRTARR